MIEICLELSDEMLVLLDSVDVSDAEEFITLDQILRGVLMRAEREVEWFDFISELDQLYQVMKSMYDCLKDWQSRGKLAKFLRSHNMRRTLHELSTLLYDYVSKFVTTLNKAVEDKRKQSEADEDGVWQAVKPSPRVKRNASPILGASRSNSGDRWERVSLESSSAGNFFSSYISVNNIIGDVKGKVFWDQLVGGEGMQADAMEVIRALMKSQSSQPGDEEYLERVLDHYHTGFISIYTFHHFLMGFGPFEDCISNLRTVIQSPWFHEHLTSHEAELLLAHQPTGTYLIRFSRSCSANFALAFVSSPGRFAHVLIESRANPVRYEIQEGAEGHSKEFGTLAAIVEYYRHLLIFPLAKGFSSRDWFMGDVDEIEVTRMLSNCEVGTFAITFCAGSPDRFAVYYVVISHGSCNDLIVSSFQIDYRHSLGDYVVQGIPPKVYPSLDAIVNELQKVLVIPYGSHRAATRRTTLFSKTPA